MRVRGGHEQRGVDFETPGAALNGAGWGELGEVAVFAWVVRRGAEYGADLCGLPIHGKLHLFFVVWDWGVDFF